MCVCVCVRECACVYVCVPADWVLTPGRGLEGAEVLPGRVPAQVRVTVVEVAASFPAVLHAELVRVAAAETDTRHQHPAPSLVTFVCVCVRVCVCARLCVCVRVCLPLLYGRNVGTNPYKPLRCYNYVNARRYNLMTGYSVVTKVNPTE